MSDIYVLKASVENKWVALDKSSGGYPHLVTGVRHAEQWTDKDAALRYAHMFKERCFQLYTLKFETVKTYVSVGDLARASEDKEYAEFIRLSQKFGAIGELKCKFSVAWVGACGKVAEVGEEFCASHLGTKCFKCSEQATRDCGHTSQFVCGTPMCNNHKHHSDG